MLPRDRKALTVPPSLWARETAPFLCSLTFFLQGSQGDVPMILSCLDSEDLLGPVAVGWWNLVDTVCLSFLWVLGHLLSPTHSSLASHAFLLPPSNLGQTQNRSKHSADCWGPSSLWEIFMCCSEELELVPGEASLPGRLAGNDSLPLTLQVFLKCVSLPSDRVPQSQILGSLLAWQCAGLNIRPWV